jgi:hypothetical protein
VITDWIPEPGETVLTREPISYATGAAVPVAGCRWFRDTERHDIQRELPGWPEGPEYTVHPTDEKAARRTGRFLGAAVPALFGAAIEALGGTGSPFSGPTALGQPTERDNEVEDFPVMWAAPGTTARTLPWQLDPARRAKDHRTHIVITDRRIVFLQAGPANEDAPQELARISRDLMDRAERMKFSRDESDVRLWFRDGSWVRLDRHDPGLGFVRHLTAPPVFVTEDDLNEAQYAVYEAWLVKWPEQDEPSVITRLPSGNIMIQQRVLEPRARSGYLTQTLTINADGVGAYDPDDF